MEGESGKPGRGASGVGASVPRKEDDRYLRGRGEFIADIRLPGMQELAFLRSPVAHARIRVDPQARRGAEHSVFTAADLAGVQPIVANSRPARLQALGAAGPRHRQGAPCRRAHRRLRRRDPRRRRGPRRRGRGRVRGAAGGRGHAGGPRAGAPLVHEHWGDNVFLETVVDADLDGDPRERAPIKVRRTFRTARQCMSPIEGRGVVAAWDRRLEQLLVYSVDPDAAHRAHRARRLPRPRSGRSPRRRARCRRRLRLQGHAAAGGGLRRVRSRAASAMPCAGSRTGASSSPATPIAASTTTTSPPMPIADGRLLAHRRRGHRRCRRLLRLSVLRLPGGGAGRRASCPAPTMFAGLSLPHLVGGDQQAADPALSRRGARRRLLRHGADDGRDRPRGRPRAARGAARATWSRRRRCRSTTSPTSISTAATIPNACAAPSPRSTSPPCARARPRASRTARASASGSRSSASRRAHGTSVYAGWGIPDGAGLRAGGGAAHAGRRAGAARRHPVARPGPGDHAGPGRARGARHPARPDPGGAWRYRDDALFHRHLGLALHGDGGRRGRAPPAASWPSASPRSARICCRRRRSRCAVARRQGDRPRRHRRDRARSARTWYLRPQDLPDAVSPGGLEVTAGYKPRARQRHLQLRRACRGGRGRSRDSASVRILDYVVVEDGGVLVNPMIVDGQVIGGAAQGIGTALYEEMPYDANGQPLASTLADYMLPGATEVPDIRIEHMETPSPYTDLRPEGHRRGRRHRPAGRDRQRGQRRARAARRRVDATADHAAARPGGAAAAGKVAASA